MDFRYLLNVNWFCVCVCVYVCVIVKSRQFSLLHFFFSSEFYFEVYCLEFRKGVFHICSVCVI
jgi:hypothetical protein